MDMNDTRELRTGMIAVVRWDEGDTGKWSDVSVTDSSAPRWVYMMLAFYRTVLGFRYQWFEKRWENVTSEFQGMEFWGRILSVRSKNLDAIGVIFFAF